jgi:hypothetical protein
MGDLCFSFEATDRSTNAASALARPASGRDIYENGKGNSLLSRMYPGLSREQAEAVVRQRIMVEQLRKVARSQSRISKVPWTTRISSALGN